MNISSYSIKLTGKAELSESIEIDKNYKVTLDGTITGSSDHSNQDGSCNRVFVFKPVLVEVIDETGKTLKAKDTRKMSQKLRGILRREWEECGEDVDEEDYYEREMRGIMLERLNRN